MCQKRNNRHVSDIVTLAVILFLILSIYLIYQNRSEITPAPLAEEVNTVEQVNQKAVLSEPTQSDTDSEIDSLQQESALPSIPESFRIAVPFTSQAPLYVWDELHEDACEEASLLMMNYWQNDLAFPDREQVDQLIIDMVSYQEKLGYEKSIKLNQLAEIGQNYLQMNRLKVNPVSSPDDIKMIIAKGSPVIVGAAGKILPNPNFRNGGPNYHMLLVKGYDQDGFITNDPGTRKGENYYYTNDELFNAIHDWDSTNILNGEKNMLFWQIH